MWAAFFMFIRMVCTRRFCWRSRAICIKLVNREQSGKLSNSISKYIFIQNNLDLPPASSFLPSSLPHFSPFLFPLSSFSFSFSFSSSSDFTKDSAHFVPPQPPLPAPLLGPRLTSVIPSYVLRRVFSSHALTTSPCYSHPPLTPLSCAIPPPFLFSVTILNVSYGLSVILIMCI
jgi:hypothetical protein